jgi:hypothetical protein
MAQVEKKRIGLIVLKLVGYTVCSAAFAVQGLAGPERATTSHFFGNTFLKFKITMRLS